MNVYIKMQLNNMIRYVDSFQKTCELAAATDDGQIDENERKQLEQIRKACSQFVRDLNRIKP